MNTANYDRALSSYGKLPDWIEALARAADSTTQSFIARDIGVSRTMINLLINNRYQRDRSRIEARVRQYLMQVECPVLGRIAGEQCRDNQAKPYTSANPVAIQLYRACHGTCAMSLVAKKHRG
jgi:hypothetical protein